MTEVIFSHYQLTWKLEGEEQAADFWLPGAYNPEDDKSQLDKYIADILNAVEINSDAFDWVLTLIETRVYRMVG